MTERYTPNDPLGINLAFNHYFDYKRTHPVLKREPYDQFLRVRESLGPDDKIELDTRVREELGLRPKTTIEVDQKIPDLTSLEEMLDKRLREEEK